MFPVSARPARPAAPDAPRLRRPSRAARQRGFLSLHELVVTAPLALLLVGVLYTQLSMTSHRSTQLTAQVQLQAQATLLMDRIEADIVRSSANGLKWRNASRDEPTGVLSIHPVTGLEGGGLVTFSPTTVVIYVYDRGTRTVRRRVWDPPPSTLGISLDPFEGFRPSDGQLDALATMDCADERLLGTQVASFEVQTKEEVPETQVGNLLIIKARFERKAVTKSVKEADLEVRTIERSIFLLDS